MVLVINVNISLVGLTLLSSIFQTSSTMKWHGLKDVELLQDAKDKGLAKASSSRLFILHFSDPRSHWVYRKSQYYQGGMRCCLMAFLLKMLSDMLQNPPLLSHIHICPKPKSPTRPRRNFISGATEFSWHSHCHKTLVFSVSPIGISVSPRWDCNLIVYVHYQTRSHRV